MISTSCRDRARGHLRRLRRAGVPLGGEHAELLRHLVKLAVQIVGQLGARDVLFLQFLEPFGQPAVFLRRLLAGTDRLVAGGSQLLLLGGIADLILLRGGKLPIDPRERRLHGRDLLAQRLDLPVEPRHLLFARRGPALELLDLLRAAEDARAARGPAARHRAARVDDLPVEGDDAEAVAALFRDGGRTVKVPNDHDAAQKLVDHAPVALVAPDQVGGNADKAVRSGQPVFVEPIPLDRGDGQKGRPARLARFEHADGALGDRLVLDDDVLHRRAERDLHRERVVVLHRDEPGDGAVNVPDRAPARLLHDVFDAL